MEFKTELNNECAFNSDKNSGKERCSPDEIIIQLKKFVAEKKLGDDSKPIDVLKQKYNCDSESCVLSQSEIKSFINTKDLNISTSEMMNKYFKPKGPRNSTEWLSNFDIDDVLRQVQQKFEEKYLSHIPFQMSDFAKTQTELAKFDWPKKYQNGARTFGVVINTDNSKGNGIHWFAMFGDFQDHNEVFTIEYFNSSGEPPLDEIMVWIKEAKHKWASSFDKPINDVMLDKIRHQSDDHSCGVYSLYYIISRLEGVPSKRFNESRIPDEVMHLFRKYLFRDEL